MDRDKALDLALANIEKQFGKGSLMKLGDAAAINIAAIPTGALSLDLALGIGGIPRGRVIEVYGPESSGKCLTAGTYVWTDHGLETVEELFARVDQPVSCTSRVTDVSSYGIRLVNEEAQLETMAGVTHNNRKPVTRVVLDSGRHVEATANHPLRVLNERGRIVWRRVAELAEGDVLVSALFGAETANGAGALSEDEAVLLGYLVAEGTLGESNRNSITFTNAHDPDVLEEYLQLVEHVLDVPAERVRTYAGKDHRIHDTAARRQLADDYGLAYTGSAAKEVPHGVRTSGAKIQRAFLSALYEGDGWIEAGPGIGLTSASRTLAEQVQLLLYGLGIPATLRTRHNDELDHDYHTVLIGSGAVDRFLEQVGFRSARRAGQVARHLADTPDTTPASRHEHLPHLTDLLVDLRDALGGDRELDRLIHDLRRSDLTGRENGSIDCSPRRLLAVLDWIEGKHVPASARPLVAQLHELAARPLTFERITAIEDAGTQPTFDVVVPGTHSFLANGVLSHNTTVALHAVAECQKQGGIAAFIDAEHALDPQYARALGVDINELLVSQPDTGEQALEIASMLIRSSAVDLIVVDSVAALTPKAEIEGDMGDSHVGLQARLMSQALRKIAGDLHRSDTAIIFINQLREKIGVMFGCFSYDTRVTLADGTQEKIGKIVNQKLPVEVLSYDITRDEFVSRKVVNWFDNGPTDEFLKFTVARGSGNGRSQFSVTANHLISTPYGWVHAGDLEVGQTVLQRVQHRLSAYQWDVLLGGLMGDGALSPSRSGHGARYRFGHGVEQAGYADWKGSHFTNLSVSRSTNQKGAVFHDVQPLPELAELRDAVYFAGTKVLSWDYLKRLSARSIAIWYQDDGSFELRSKGLQERTRGGSGRSEICVQAFDPGSRQRLRDHLADTFELHANLTERGGNAYLVFPTAETAKLHELVAPYVHPSMAYKLLPRFQGQFDDVPVFEEPRDVAVPMPIVDIARKAPNGRHTHRFDIEIEGTHSYLADGVVVHNSPETTPGGRALKFYSSVRLDVRRIETLKDGTDAVGNRVRVKVVKNKVAPPFRQAEFDIIYGEGISKQGSLIDVGVEEGIIRKAGAWYTYDGEQLGQGKENARTFLKEHEDVALEIEKKVKEKLGLSPLAATEHPVEDGPDDGFELG
ncbi:MAG: LAGLIDADG family homing endonuclease [Nitriliruptor sp.]